MYFARNTQEKISKDQNTSPKALKRRIDGWGWGIFILMLGLIWLFPEGSIPEGSWLIGLAMIIFGVSHELHLVKNDTLISKIAFGWLPQLLRPVDCHRSFR